MSDLTARLRDDLGAALRQRDLPKVKVLRSVLSSIANAEAVPVADSGREIGDGPIAGAVAGLGAAETERRVLTDDDVRAIIAAERDELLDTAALVENRAPDRSRQMRDAAEFLSPYALVDRLARIHVEPAAIVGDSESLVSIDWSTEEDLGRPSSP